MNPCKVFESCEQSKDDERKKMKPAMLFESGEEKKVTCGLCNHRCLVPDRKLGICNVRQNKDGQLYTLAYGRVIAAHVDPIEKKPLYHFLPGSFAFSIGTAGCNFACGFCQNWQISQAVRKGDTQLPGKPMAPEQIVSSAVENNCRAIAYTYTEPTIFFEYAYDTARLAKDNGLKNIFVSNGYMTRQAIDTIKPFLDAINVDLKSMNMSFYKEVCKGRLQPVLDNIRYIRKAGIWLEITTLIVPDANDSEKELRDTAAFIADVDPAIPWHISRFHPDYQYTDAAATPLSVMTRAHAIGKEQGLHYVYMGNILDADNDTCCPQCGKRVIERYITRVKTRLLEKNKCSDCGMPLAGVYE
jgi:pyruvate formate lyase activating enzyme